MANTSPRPNNPWIAFAAGVVATLAVVLVWWLITVSRNVGDDVKLVAPAPGELPLPRLPDGPKLPDAPTPTPQ